MTLAATSASSLNLQIFNKEPGKNFTGMVPAFLSHIGKFEEGSVTNAHVFLKLLNKTSLETASLSNILKNGRLACITYDKGVIKSICVRDYWVKLLEKEKTKHVVLSSGGGDFLYKGSVAIDGNIGISQLHAESYSKMTKLCVPLLKV